MNRRRRGNVAKVEADADEIARRYLAGEISISAVLVPDEKPTGEG